MARLPVQASLGGRRWDQAYQAKYGSVADFMRTHPEAFYQSANGAFYRPEAPARLPPASNAASSAGTSTALIIPPGAFTHLASFDTSDFSCRFWINLM